MIKKIIIHCSDSIYGNAAMITKWHIQRKFSTIGYHYVILNGIIDSHYEDNGYDGHVETGRACNQTGAHTLGHNVDSIGICLVGKPGDFTQNQYDSLEKLLGDLFYTYGEIPVFQHSDFDKNKSYCAGINHDRLQEVVNRGCLLNRRFGGFTV